MTLSPFDLMQKAVDIVDESPHPTNKIAATLAGEDVNGKDFYVSATNFWPGAIEKAFGPGTKIGNSSGTVHAETACIIKAQVTDASSLFITDPPCPNCVKNMAEAGIKHLYIDHKGFDKDFARRRGGDFENMSLRICERAGINVSRLFRKDKKIEEILHVPDNYSPPLEKPPLIEKLENKTEPEEFVEMARAKSEIYGDRIYAAALARSHFGQDYIISAETHPVIGYTSKTIGAPEDKYTFLLQPINRILMTASRYGLRIDKDCVFSSRVPTARELVNMVGAELTNITIADSKHARDKHAMKALEQLREAGVLNVQ